MNNKHKSKIVIVVPYAPPNKTGGGLSALNFALYLNKHGYTARILTFNRNNTLDKVSYYAETEIKRILYFNKYFIYKLFSVFIIIPAFIREIFNSTTIIIYGGHIIGWELFVIAGRVFKKRVIFRSTMYSDDDTISLLNRSHILHPIRYIALKCISNYWALNPKFSESYQKCYSNKEKIILSPQGVDIDKYCPINKEAKKALRSKLNLPDDITIIISVGILANRKGYSEIFEILSEIETPFVYLVLGEYELKNGHHRKSASKNAIKLYNRGKQILGEKVRFEGYVDNVEQYLMAADIFLTNSVKEGFPNALLEAMATGLPILAKSSLYLQNYFLKHDDNCILYENKKEALIAFKNILYNNATQEQVKANARKTIETSYSYKHIVHNLDL